MFNVCLVEDEKNLNDLIKTYLEKANYKVIQCYSGKEAMEVDEKIHLWILDIMLGDDISGYDIIKHIRETDEKVPIIFTSARDQDLDKIIGLELGSDDYITKPFMTGFLEGYNTMDALASLAFGIVVVKVIYDLGVEDENVVAKSTLKSGIISCVLMAVIYVAVTFIGVRSRYVLEPAENGGAAFAQIAEYYLGKGGLIILAIMVTVACLKTAIGLITSCSEMFTTIFPKGPCYKVWVYIFSAISFTLANLGLSSIIKISIPVLMFLYPLAIVLILLALFGKLFNNSKTVSYTHLTLPTIA